MYVDTSVLAAYYCPEPLSERVEAVLRRARNPTIGHLTEVELHAAVNRKVRLNEIDRAVATKILTLFDTHILQGRYTLLALDVIHFRLAKTWLAQFIWPLRTLDALHLAVAASNELPLLTADKTMAEIAGSIGLSVTLLRT